MTDRRMTSRFLFLTLLPFLLLSSCTKKEAPPPPEDPITIISLKPGDTLSQSLRDAELPDHDNAEIIKHLSTVFSPRRCRAGDRYEISFDGDKRWQSFNYYPPGVDYYSIDRAGADNAVQVAKKTRATKREVMTAQGTITVSLWEAMSAQGLSPDLIIDFADIFAWQIDFLTETQNGDRFKVIWERYVTADGTVLSRKILGAQYTASTQINTAVLHTNAAGQSDYFTPEGKSLRSAFLKAPLQFRRISSYFTHRRYHPVLKYFRPHLGIDYAAPSGTPVSAIGDGTVTFAGWHGGFGRFIKIRHANGYESWYGHLSRYGKGIRGGARVRQGQLIAYVGSSGLSSGPHLDFRMKKDGRFVNFLRLRIPSAGGVPAAEKDQFRKTKVDLFTQLANIH